MKVMGREVFVLYGVIREGLSDNTCQRAKAGGEEQAKALRSECASAISNCKVIAAGEK